MALQEVKPQGPSDAGPTAREPRDRPRERGLCRAGGIAALFQGVRSSGAPGSQDAPPLRPLLLGLLLLAALPGHCWADSGKHLRPRQGLEHPNRLVKGGGLFAAPLGFSLRLALATAGELSEICLGKGIVGGEERGTFLSFFFSFLDKLQMLPDGPTNTLRLIRRGVVRTA